MPNNRYLSLRYPVTASGQELKNRSINFLQRKGWKITGETIEPGHMKGDEACCLAMICLPLGFAAGRTDHVVTVSLQYEGADEYTEPHEHQLVQLDYKETTICAICNDLMTDAQISAVTQAEWRRTQERAAAEREARVALARQKKREKQEQRAVRMAYLDAHPGERDRLRRRLQLFAAGAVILVVAIVLAVLLAHVHQ